MRKSIWITLTVLAALFSTYLFAATDVIGLSGGKYLSADSVLLQTHWKQMGGFERYTPDHMRLGCWSTALAQIMYYHKLKPFGRFRYTSRKGFVINEQLDSTTIKFNQLPIQIDSSTTDDDISALARYNYYAALAVQKDFGTDSYMHKLVPASLLESHYHVKVKRYISWQHLLPYTSGKLKSIIKKEINDQQPLLLHFADLKNFGHSVVVDGYKQSAGVFWVHLNQGQGGPQDGWYDFDKDLLRSGDRKLRVLYSFQPLNAEQ